MVPSDRELGELIDSVVAEEFQSFDLVPEGRETGRPNDTTPAYLLKHRHEYIRTLRDVCGYAEKTGRRRALEIGAFFGMVSICLARLGFEVVASDLPEYMEMEAQERRFARHGIGAASVRLEDYVLPFADESFDIIIMCEVMEHLNFNPLPLLKEVNRLGTPGSLFYLSLPNLAQYRNRLRFLLGRPILQPIDDYFGQLAPDSLVIVNGHWREYTGPEVAEMLGRLGFDIERQYYFSFVETFEKPTAKNRLTRLVFRMFPSFKENQTTLAIRNRRTPMTFHIPRTVHPTLRRL